jgi:septum formation protein
MSGKDEEKKTPKKVILGSSSYARQQIIGELGYDFTIVTADLDERAIGDRSHASNAEKLVVTLAHAKACEILHKINRHCGDAVLLITGDQVVTYKDKILEKPLSAKEAKEMLLGYCTAPCRTVGSIVITDMVRNVRHDAVFIATIYFKEISEEAMEALIVEGGIMYCAGALMIENKLMEPFQRVDHATQ